jgi:hypothetical protein
LCRLGGYRNILVIIGVKNETRKARDSLFLPLLLPEIITIINMLRYVFHRCNCYEDSQGNLNA